MTRRKSLRRLCLFPVTVVALVLGHLMIGQGAALAHGDIQDSSPAAGAELTEPPKKVTLTLAEAAARGSSLVVTDGCEREVSGNLDIDREIVETAITAGEPGRWLVNLRSFSAVDGHVVKDAFTFRVSGKKDCTPEDDIDPETNGSPDTSSRAPIDNPDQEPSSFPVIPFALGTVAIIAVALAVRRPWDKS